MAKYKCLNCGYKGNELIFQFTDYTYCLATNEIEPEYKEGIPDWVTKKLSFGEAEIGKPVGCPKCHSWGIINFEVI